MKPEQLAACGVGGVLETVMSVGQDGSLAMRGRTEVEAFRGVARIEVSGIGPRGYCDCFQRFAVAKLTRLTGEHSCDVLLGRELNNLAALLGA